MRTMRRTLATTSCKKQFLFRFSWSTPSAVLGHVCGDARFSGLLRRYTTVFSFILPVGVVFIPVIDICVKKLGLVGTLHVTNVIGVIVGALSLVPDVHVQIANFLMFAMFRAFLYGIVGAFFAQTFGLVRFPVASRTEFCNLFLNLCSTALTVNCVEYMQKTLGRITGTVYTLAAAINLLQVRVAPYLFSMSDLSATAAHAIEPLNYLVLSVTVFCSMWGST